MIVKLAILIGPIGTGIKQGLCPTLFSIFIYDLDIEIKESNIGINLNANGGPNLDYIFNI